MVASASGLPEFMCGRGHRVIPGPTGCPTCGSKTFHLIEPAEDEKTPDAEASPPKPPVRPTPQPSGRCRAGHQVPLSQARCDTCGEMRIGASIWGCGHLRQAGDQYCGSCGYSDSLEPTKATWLTLHPQGARISALALVIVLVLVGLVIWQVGKPASGRTAAGADGATPTTRLTTQEACAHNLAVWVASMARDILNGGDGLGPAMTFGAQSTIAQEIMHLESTFTAEVFQKGTSTAIADVTAASSQACSQMVQDDVNLLVTTSTPS